MPHCLTNALAWLEKNEYRISGGVPIMLQAIDYV
jgi:hypothetical protein